MKSQKLSDLIFNKPAKGFKIKDYAKVDYIFKLYFKNHFDSMSREIYFYKTWEFFIDLSVFLDRKYKSDLIKEFLYTDIVDEYFWREAEIKEEMSLRRERKKYLL